MSAGEENNLLGDVMICSFNHVDHSRSLTEAKFWPVYGGRNWGLKGGLESLIPLASRRFLYIQLYPLRSLPPPKKVPNPLAKTCIRKWNWYGSGGSHESCPNPLAWQLTDMKAEEQGWGKGSS